MALALNRYRFPICVISLGYLPNYVPDRTVFGDYRAIGQIGDVHPSPRELAGEILHTVLVWITRHRRATAVTKLSLLSKHDAKRVASSR